MSVNSVAEQIEFYHKYACDFLSRWLQPDSYADPQKTALILNKDDIRCGWPATVVVQTKDQYGDVVHVPNMKVEVKAVPVSQKKSVQPENVKKLQRLPGGSSPSSTGPDLTFGGLPTPKLEATYEPMIVKEARYIAITMMKVRFMELAHDTQPTKAIVALVEVLLLIGRYVAPCGLCRKYTLHWFRPADMKVSYLTNKTAVATAAS